MLFRSSARQAINLSRSLLDSEVLYRLDPPGPDGRSVAMSADVQDNFALNQPLAPFALATLDVLDPDEPAYHLDVVSVIESVLDDPRQVLFAQRSKAKGEAVAEMKADGIEYDQRMLLLDDITWPQPLLEILEATLEIYRQTHPWVSEDALSPKSIVRDMYERAMTFGEFIAFYQLTRSEGVVLRYLTDAYRTLRQTVPEAAGNEQLDDVIEWLGETIRQTDSSLLEEWEALTDPEAVAAAAARAAAGAPLEVARPITGNERAFRVMVRNAMFRRVELAARDEWRTLAELERFVAAQVEPPREVLMSAEQWDAALALYYDDHDHIGTGAEARGTSLLSIVSERGPAPGMPSTVTAEGEASSPESVRRWLIQQTLADPEGDHDWVIEAYCDLDASDQLGEPLVLSSDMRRLGG